MKKWLLFAVSAAFLVSVHSIAWATSYTSIVNGGWREVGAGGTCVVWGVTTFPGGGDSATINHNVTSTNNESCAQLSMNGGLDLTGFTLTLGDDSDWSSGNLYGDVLFQGSTFTWSGGTYKGAFNNPVSATFVLASTNTKTLRWYSTLHNYGTIRQTAGILAITGNPNDAYLYNWTNSLYDIQVDGTNLTSDYGHFWNYGTLRKSAGSGSSWVKSEYNQYGGTVEVQTGTLVLAASGTRTNGGTFTVAGGCTLDLTGGQSPKYYGTFSGTGSGVVQLASGQIGQNSDCTFNFTNGFYWRGGTVYASFPHNQGLMILEGDATKTIQDYGQLYNYGTIRQTGAGALALNGNPNQAFLHNWSNALYDIQADGTNLTSDQGHFENYGTLRKSAGSGSSWVKSTFSNHNGTVEVQTGTLVLAADGIRSSGTLTVSEGCTLDLTGGYSPKYNGNFSGAGSGIVQLASGQIGQDSYATFNLPNGLYWRGGSIWAAFLYNQGLMTLDGTNTKTIRYYGQLHNYGMIRQTGSGAVDINGNPNDAYLFNWTNATYDIQADGTNLTSDYGTFMNYGTLRKSAGAGSSWVKSTFNNYTGTVEVQTGTLVLASAGTRSNGTFTVAAGATLDLNGGYSPKYMGTFSGAGSGIVQLAGGQLAQDSDATFNLPNGLYWRGGTLYASFLRNRGLLILDGSSTLTIRFYGQLDNYGTIRHTGSSVLDINGNPNDAYLFNRTNSLYDIQVDGTNLTSNYGSFRNYGTLLKSAGSGVSRVKSDFFNYGGTVESQTGTLQFDTFTHTGGVLRLNGGNLSVPAFTLQAGTLEGTGTVTVAGTLTSAGSVSPGLSVGALNIAGNYAQNAGGTLAVEIGGRTPGTQYDRLGVSGSVALNGTLSVVLTNGFTPAVTDSFMIVTCASRSGAFSSTNAPVLGADRCWRVAYSNTAVYLQVKNIAASLTSPTNGAVFQPPTNVTLSATVTDTAGTITQVAFYAGADLIGVSHSSTNPYTCAYDAVVGSYTITARARDSVGLVVTSAPVSIIVAPLAPAGVNASAGTYTDKVLVSWASAAGATGYQVWRNTVNDSGTATMLDTTTGTTYDDTGAAIGALYYYWVKAGSALATSLFSSSASGYRALTAPADVAASDNLYPDKVRVTWTASSEASGYQVFRHTINDSSGAGQVGATTATTYDDTTAVAGTNYYYWLKATNAVGASAFSLPDTGGRAPPSLDPPANLSASDGTYTDKVALAWGTVSGASGYQVWRAPENNSGSAINLGNATLASYDDNSSAVRSATMFYYWVKAWNGVITSDFSAVDSGFCRMVENPELISGQPMAGDYDGDLKADPAVYDLSSGRLFAWLSSANYLLVTPVVTFQIAEGDLPVAGDFDGDRLADPGVFQRLTGSWYIWLSSAGYYRVGPLAFGVDLNDMPIPADYDGDLKADPAICNAGTLWYVWLSSAGYFRIGPLAIFRVDVGDTPAPGQFDADRSADPAVYQATSGNWYIWLSSPGYLRIGPITLGTTGEHLPVPADYDGDGLADPAAYVPTNGVWRIWESGNGYALKELPLR